MGSDKMRDEFEAWASEHEFLGGCHFNRKPSGNYHDVDFQHAWESWQASRAAVVVSLPIDVSGGLYRLAVEDCTRCIEAAGLQVTQ